MVKNWLVRYMALKISIKKNLQNVQEIIVSSKVSLGGTQRSERFKKIYALLTKSIIFGRHKVERADRSW